nr:MAG TPA: Baseplate component [Caudoviricetes sp.]
MAKTYNRLEIDVNKKPNSIGIRPVQHDTKSRYLDVCLYENGVPIDLTGEQVRITFRKADGGTFFNQGEVTDATAGRCQFALTNEILSEAKAVEAQISVWNAGGQILSTQVFEIYVTAAIPWTDSVESENEYGVLVVLFQEIQDALDTMHKIAATFGEPGDKAAEYGVDTFWGILETLAQRGDVESATERIMNEKIKAYLNSTLGTSEFQSLDKIISGLWGGKQEYAKPGTYTFKVPMYVNILAITACAGGGGGSGGNGNGYGGAGGSGGMCVKKKVSVEPGTVLSIQIGAGGTGGKPGVYAPGRGTDGGSTVISNVFSLAGGQGAYSESESVGEGSGAGGQSHSKGSAGLLGAGGEAGGTSAEDGGGGGGSLGDGGNGGKSGSNGNPGTKGSGGGGGGYRANGGNGGDGYVSIEWGLSAV